MEVDTIDMGSNNERIRGVRDSIEKTVVLPSAFVIISISIGYVFTKTALRGNAFVSNTSLLIIAGVLTFGLTGIAAGIGKDLKVSLLSGLTWAISASIFTWILIYDSSLAQRFTWPYLYALIYYIFEPLRIVMIPATVGYIAGISYHHRNHLEDQRTALLAEAAALILVTTILWAAWVTLNPGSPMPIPH